MLKTPDDFCLDILSKNLSLLFIESRGLDCHGPWLPLYLENVPFVSKYNHYLSFVQGSSIINDLTHKQDISASPSGMTIKRNNHLQGKYSKKKLIVLTTESKSE